MPGVNKASKLVGESSAPQGWTGLLVWRPFSEGWEVNLSSTFSLWKENAFPMKEMLVFALLPSLLSLLLPFALDSILTL